MAGSQDPIERAAEDINRTEGRRRQRYSSRTCPTCGALKMRRTRLPVYFRPLRWIGLDVASYRCDNCKRKFKLRRH